MNWNRESKLAKRTNHRNFWLSKQLAGGNSVKFAKLLSISTLVLNARLKAVALLVSTDTKNLEVAQELLIPLHRSRASTLRRSKCKKIIFL